MKDIHPNPKALRIKLIELRRMIDTIIASYDAPAPRTEAEQKRLDALGEVESAKRRLKVLEEVPKVDRGPDWHDLYVEAQATLKRKQELAKQYQQ